MFFGDPLVSVSLSKKKRAEKQRQIEARNQQVADLDANRKALQQAVRDKYTSPPLLDATVPKVALKPKGRTAQFDGPFGVVRPRPKLEVVSDPVAKPKPTLAKPNAEEDLSGFKLVRLRS